MNTVRTLQELEQAVGDARPAFVPTMGALHAGHVALVKRASEIAQADGSPVVVSIFVNPTQFGPTEDFARYPRQFDQDVQLVEAAGATIVFAPDIATVYPAGNEIVVPPLPAVATQPQLEEAHRPTHFAGVCQIVARLFDLVQPGAAIFGEKDYQQLQVIKAMVSQEVGRWAGLEILSHPTVREPDGLAMSSRNVYLKPNERDRALGLFRALQVARSLTKSAFEPPRVEQAMREVLAEHELRVDYAVVRDSSTLMPVDSANGARCLIAARLGDVRLIDNLPASEIK